MLCRTVRMLLLAISGALLMLCFVGMGCLRGLGQQTIGFLLLFGLAYVAYASAVSWSLRWPSQRRASGLILGLAVLFRAALLFTTPPTLSSDVYRYIWDGRLVNSGVNPYGYAVDSPLLDRLATPLRGQVNHADMASPYLPVAQLYFAAIYRLAPESPLAFQAAAALFDLLTGIIVLDLLRRVGLSGTRVLIYLWNPLVIVEFAHGAHLDALMICLMMAGLWLLVSLRSRFPSVIAIAAATLTKGLPLLIVPLLARRWRLRHIIVYLALLVGACLPFARGAGWGLSGPLDGVGLFGALRVYGAWWNYNAGLYRALEAGIRGLWPPNATPQATLAAKCVAGATLGLVAVATWRIGRRCRDDLALLRLMVIPLSAYLLLATTIHPWYVTLLLPLLPFLASSPDGPARGTRLLWAWLTFAWAVSLSYLTYLDPANLRVYPIVVVVEYVPLYVLLIWSVWPARTGDGSSVVGQGPAQNASS